MEIVCFFQKIFNAQVKNAQIWRYEFEAVWAVFAENFERQPTRAGLAEKG